MVTRWLSFPRCVGSLILLTLMPLTARAQFPIVANDVVLGLSRSDPSQTLNVARGPREAMGGSSEGAFWDVASIQAVEFDNLGGISHNPSGNLLGLNFGSSTTGGTIFSLTTSETATPASQLIGDTTGTGGGGLTLTRLGGLSISPDNSKIAAAGYDTGRIVFYDYAAGDGLGGAAALSNARESAAPVVGTFDTQGTAWLNSNSVLSFAADGSLVSTDATLLSSSTLLQLPTGGGGETNRSEYTDLEYNPTVSPYIYASYGGFDRDASTTINLLFLVDPNAGFSLVKTVDLSTSMESAREIALDADGNLLLAQFNASIDILANATDPSSLTDGSSYDWYTPEVTSSFSGIDVAIGLPIVVPSLPGDFNANGTLDAADIDLLSAAVAAASSELSFDVDADGSVAQADRTYWVSSLSRTFFGDANLDGEFGSGDLVTVFSAGRYETGQAAGWSEGDWDGNGIFDTGDLVTAFSEGGYETGPKAAVSAVPEPTSMLLLLSTTLGLLPLWRRTLSKSGN